jgi:hypothetical protein
MKTVDYFFWLNAMRFLPFQIQYEDKMHRPFEMAVTGSPSGNTVT